MAVVGLLGMLVSDQPSIRLAALAALLLGAISYALRSARRRESTRHDRPAAAPDEHQAALVSARVGEPTHAVARFDLHTQHAPHQLWHGSEPLWIAVSETWVWLLHQTQAGGIGGVKSRFSRAGINSRWTERRSRSHHHGELSWPADPWFIAGELHGPRPQRLRLIGLLAGDELGIRHLVTRTNNTTDTTDHQTRS